MLVVTMTCRRHRKIKSLKPGTSRHIPISLGEQGGRPHKKFTLSFEFVVGLALFVSFIMYLFKG